MKTFEEFDESTGQKRYKVRIGGKVLSFASTGERERYLYFLYLALVNKNQQLIDALVWLWEQRQAEILRVMKKYFSVFAAVLLPLASLQVATSNNFMVQHMLNQLVDLVLAAAPHPTATSIKLGQPNAGEYLNDFQIPDQHETFEEKFEQTRRTNRAEKELAAPPSPSQKNGM